jgi:hypothetical protein
MKNEMPSLLMDVKICFIRLQGGGEEEAPSDNIGRGGNSN